MIPAIIKLSQSNSHPVSALGDSSSSFSTSFAVHDDENVLPDRETATDSIPESPRSSDHKVRRKMVIKVRAKDLSHTSGAHDQCTNDKMNQRGLESLLHLLSSDKKIPFKSSSRCCECGRPVANVTKRGENDSPPRLPKRKNSDEELPLQRICPDKKLQYMQDLGITDEMIKGLKRVGLHITEC